MKNYSFAARVWLSSAIIGPLLIGLWFSIAWQTLEGFAYSFFASIVSLFFSLPALFVFSIMVFWIESKQLNDVVKMVILSVVAVALTFFSFHFMMLIFLGQKALDFELYEVYLGAIYYVPAILVIAWFYPKYMRDGESEVDSVLSEAYYPEL